MRQVAVTEGDKVEAQIKFGYSVNGYGMGDLVTLSGRFLMRKLMNWLRYTRIRTRWHLR